jgi:methyl-accepting chemotaxis protein
MNIESDDLEKLRETTSRALLAVLWLHLPICVLIGLMRGTDWLLPAVFMALLALAATLSWRMAGNGLSTSLVFAVALMGDVALFTFQFAGHPWQIDIHMYFFAALACLVAYCDYRPVIVGAIAVALHHLLLNFILPAAVFPGGADFGRVVLHAVIVVIEAAVLVWLAHKLAQLF